MKHDEVNFCTKQEKQDLHIGEDRAHSFNEWLFILVRYMP